MVETRWNEMFLLLILVVQFTGALSRRSFISSTVREGDEATLSCESLMDGYRNCDKTTWIFSNSRAKSVELVALGQIKNKTMSDRLRVTTNCSLLIKNVTVEDVGHYTCRQFVSGSQGEDAVVDLSVVSMTERNNTDMMVLNCSVRTNEVCKPTVKWLYMGRDVDNNYPRLKTSQSSCSATVTILIYNLIHFTPPHRFFKCSVSTKTNEEPMTFDLCPPGKGKNPAATNTTGSATDNDKKPPELWWVYIIVAVVVVALLIIAVKIIRSRRTKGKNMQGNDNIVLTSEPAAAQSAPESSPDMADPEDGISYASISYTKNANSKAKIRSKNDTDDTVTYSTVKASSTDPSNLYATVNKPSGP